MTALSLKLELTLDEPFADPSPRGAKPSMRSVAIAASQLGEVTADDLIAKCGCSRTVAGQVLITLHQDGVVRRVRRGVYMAKRVVAGWAPRVQLYSGIKAEHQQQLTDAEAFLSRDAPQFPGATTPLPDASSRAVRNNDRGGR